MWLIRAEGNSWPTADRAAFPLKGSQISSSTSSSETAFFSFFSAHPDAKTHEGGSMRDAQEGSKGRLHATAKITVQNSETLPYDDSDPKLIEIHLHETFAGEIEGESPVRALQVLRENKSANLVSLQRFRGKIGGRQGTFVLQGSEVVENGKIKATWFVVPGSGTGELRGLRGQGGFEGEFGKRSEGWLDYWFE
jgi:uncharacterized protein DUF3224